MTEETSTLSHFPLLGTKENHECFEYLLTSQNETSATLFFPNWLVNRPSLQVGETIHLHLPDIQRYTIERGKISQVEWDMQQNCHTVSINKITELPKDPFTSIIISRSIAEEISQEFHVSSPQFISFVIKNCYFLKRGVEIYLKHLIPLLSRIGGYSRKEFPKLKEQIFDEMLKQVHDHTTKLQLLYLDLSFSLQDHKDISLSIDLEELRSWIESEINFDLFSAIFEGGLHYPYIEAIKNLEKVLYTNYNTAVLAYTSFL